uniref:HD domain-containing protein n=1 Tax=Pseudothermotoga hypogea TaxID=57487 RepID=A0A832MMR1_9THEM
MDNATKPIKTKILVLSNEIDRLFDGFFFEEQNLENLLFCYDMALNTQMALRLIEREPCAYSTILVDRTGFEEDELARFASQVSEIASPIFPKILQLDDHLKGRDSHWYECILNNLFEIPMIAFVQFITELIRLKDRGLFEHLLNVKTYSAELAKLCVKEGIIDERTAEFVSFAGFFHDIGKVLISDEILHKPSKLTSEEFESMKSHTVLGAKLFEKSIKTNKENRLLTAMYQVIKYHHERFDGKGYPEGLQSDQIPIEARIVSITDVFDALTSSRSYRKAYTPSEALSIMTSDEGHFDPQILDVFLNNFEQIRDSTSQSKFA